MAIESEDFDDLGHFNLVNIPSNERADLERHFRDLVGQNDDKSDFEGFEPEDAYEVPDFDDWEKVENDRNIVEFNERTGSRRVDGSRNAADYFQLSYTDKLFTHIANFTNRNAQQKKGGWNSAFFHFNIWNTHLDHILDIFTWNNWE